MNYFEFYNIPISFSVDAVALKKTFYGYSKKYHPDFFTLESEEEQAKILELSTLNTQAYKTLSDIERRMKYVLEITGTMGEEGQTKLPQDFLGDMMDINEAIMELEFDPDIEALEYVKKQVQEFDNQLVKEIKPVLDNYIHTDTSTAELEKIKIFFLKKRYLLRIFENLSNFASC
ncbi:MAG: Fe-S protein assembly co-chaperone HscB [Saprospiraceae bacterium]|nr:Fe-S protein assembly co-chaperone HscB [Saprospiraceae bacterium]